MGGINPLSSEDSFRKARRLDAVGDLGGNREVDRFTSRSLSVSVSLSLSLSRSLSLSLSLPLPLYIYIYMCVCIHTYIRMNVCVCVYVRTHVKCMHVKSMHACMCVCMYVCMYVCMHVYMYVCSATSLQYDNLGLPVSVLYRLRFLIIPIILY